MKPIFRIWMIAVALVLGAAWYIHWSKSRSLSSGDVFVRDQTGDKAKLETSETTPANHPAQPQEVADNGTEATAPSRLQPREAVATIPASDTISRNPPNGLIVAGSGRFQLYRQGDITWRMDTATGAACVLFATEVQWRKTLVYENGCGSR
jgi:hypothetical protein